MFIKGIDKTRPVLLLLHGGPGLTDYFLAQDYPTELEKEFVVCYWEQLGTGLSYHKDLDQAEMTTQRLIDDTISVTNYLKERFNKDKIYLMGHSFGSYLGINTIAKSPDLYHAYIAMSQITNQLESEKIAYSYMLNEYITNGNKKMEKKMNEFQILNSDEDFQSYLNSNIRDLVMHDLGVGTTHDMDSVVKGLFFPSLRCKDYTQLERINIWKGKVFSRGTGLMNEVYAFNAETEIPKIDIPIYFFAGIYDYTVAYELQLSYFNNIDAPLKGFYTFNNSAHSPVFEEPDFALEILVNDVLNLTTSLQDN
jgi:pimeloyl-ACP methyl ester carboxylesterase